MKHETVSALRQGSQFRLWSWVKDEVARRWYGDDKLVGQQVV